MEEIKDTEDLGYTEIEIAKVGEYTGSSKDGDPIPEHLTEDALKAIVEKSKDKKILLDKQHKSMAKGLDRDDSACGWIESLSFKNGSIFGKVFWTKLGRSLVDSKILRFVSPVFRLNKDGVPEDLMSVGLVNQPALSDISPVLNQATEISTEDIEMSKEEVIELIKETVSAMMAENQCVKNEEGAKEETAEVVEEVKEEVKEDVEQVEDMPEAPVETSTVEVVENEIKEETKEEKEVIKEECLNSSPYPSVSQEDEWKTLSGKAFWDWVSKHPNACK